MTEITVRVATEFAGALSDNGVTAEMLQRIIASPQRIAALVLAIQEVQETLHPVTLQFTPIETFQGNHRPINTLKRYGLWYVEELTTVSRYDLLAMRYMGEDRVGNIERVMRERDIYFMPEGASRREAIETLYGSLNTAPLRLLLLFWQYDWTSDGKFASLSVHSLADLLTCSRAELYGAKAVMRIGSIEVSVFTTPEIKQIAWGLRRLGLHLREE